MAAARQAAGPENCNDVVASEEAWTARASGDPKAIAKAEARREAALKALKADRDTMVDHYRGRYVKHRSQVIARTESMRASNLGVIGSLEAGDG